MKHILIFVCAMLMVVLPSCRTTQKNMNDAYVIAVAARDNDNLGLDSTIYSQIRREMTQGSVTVNGEEVAVNTQWVRPTEGAGAADGTVKRYNVVVGQFKQLFNAKSMRERLLEQGYPGAFVVETREPYYFVAIGTTDDIAQAVRILHKAMADEKLKMKEPLPFILEAAQHRR